MNKRILLALLLILLAAFGLRVLLRNKLEFPEMQPVMKSQGRRQDIAALSQSQEPSAISPASIALHASVASTNSGNKTLAEEVKIYMEHKNLDSVWDWRQPINFYGKVVDESSNALSEVSVGYTWSDLSPRGTSTNHIATDASGLFSIHETGKRISITVSKDGYYSSRRDWNSYEYANPADGLFKPDAGNPVLFHLRKKGQAEPLIHGQKLFGSRVDGTLTYIDLTRGKAQLAPAGDLTLSCTRSARNTEGKFDWSFALSVPDGGLMESTNEFMLVAPTDGYQSTFTINHKAGDSDWVAKKSIVFSSIAEVVRILPESKSQLFRVTTRMLPMIWNTF